MTTPGIDVQAARVATALRDAEERREPIDPIRYELRSDDIEAAYLVQAINTDIARAQGRRLIGHKIGLTSAAVQRQLGVDQPDFGVLFADMAFADGEPVPIERVLQPRAEAEVALVFDRDLQMPHPTIVDVVTAVGYALPAIELVGSRIRDWDISIIDTIADNASCGMFVLGTRPVAVSGFDHRLCGMVMEIDGEEASIGAGAACLGNPLNAALWLARQMVTRGTPIEAGEVVLTGALGPMAPVRAGQVVEARIDGLGPVRAELEEEAS
jgi:2-keto-4-pentenoate hydratase